MQAERQTTAPKETPPSPMTQLVAVGCSLQRMVRRWVRRLSRFAWEEMLFDVGRVELKFGRKYDGQAKNWTEWNAVRDHLRESGKLRQPKELESPNDKARNGATP